MNILTVVLSLAQIPSSVFHSGMRYEPLFEESGSILAVVQPIGRQYESARNKKSNNEEVATLEQRVIVIDGDGVAKQSTLTLVCAPPGRNSEKAELVLGQLYLLMGTKGSAEAVRRFPDGIEVVGNTQDVYPLVGIPLRSSTYMRGENSKETIALTLMAQLSGATPAEVVQFLRAMPRLPLSKDSRINLADVYYEPDATCDLLAEMAMQSPLHQRLLIQGKLLSQKVRGSQAPYLETVVALKDTQDLKPFGLSNLWFNKTAKYVKDLKAYTPDSVALLELAEQADNRFISRWALHYVHDLKTHAQKRRYAMFLRGNDLQAHERVIQNLARMEKDVRHRIPGDTPHNERDNAIRLMRTYWKERFNIED